MLDENSHVRINRKLKLQNKNSKTLLTPIANEVRLWGLCTLDNVRETLDNGPELNDLNPLELSDSSAWAIAKSRCNFCKKSSCEHSSKKHNQIFVAVLYRVVLGNFIVKNLPKGRPPPLESRNAQLCLSQSFGGVRPYSAFFIFQNAQVHPEYAVFFRRFQKR